MKHSLYNILFEKEGYTLVFNTMKCSKYICCSDEIKRFNDFALTLQEMKDFIDLGMIVEDNVDEVQVFLNAASRRLEKFFSDEVDFRIYTTLACNAKCPYCYQKDLKTISMTEDVAKQVSDYIIQKAGKYRIVRLQWFGGEPLCNYKVISQITDKVKYEAKNQGKIFESSMVSNGYLFTEELVIKAYNDWDLREIQITLDGKDSEYEKVKQFGDKCSFVRVINNIKALSEIGVVVNIRLNYSHDNIGTILELLDFLSKEFKNNKNINIAGHTIFDKTKNISVDTFCDLDILFYRKMKKLGLSNYNDFENMKARWSRCMAYYKNHLIIYPNGELYKCPQLVGRKDEIVGDFNSMNSVYSKWIEEKLSQKCLACKFLPICNGGCIYLKRSGSLPCGINEKIILSKMECYLDEYLERLSNE